VLLRGSGLPVRACFAWIPMPELMGVGRGRMPRIMRLCDKEAVELSIGVSR